MSGRTTMECKNYVDGSWRPGQGEPLVSTDPYDGSPVYEGRHSTPADINTAVAAARQAFPAWSGLTSAARQQHLRQYTQQLEQHKSELAELISREMGKPRWESLTEVGAMIGKVEISIRALEDRCGLRESPLGDALSVTRFKPHGVVAVFGPFNFPAHLPNGHIVPALLAGNTVVFKPSEMTPGVGELMTTLWHESGLPPGTMNLVQGGQLSGKSLADHPDIDGIFFTGSSSVGRAIHAAYAGRPEKVLALEMGGNNPLIIHDVDDVEAAVYWTMQSAYLTAGQRCVCARRLIVTEGSRNQGFLDRLVEAVGTIRCGHYTMDPEPFMGPLVTDRAALGVLRDQEELLQRGATALRKCELSSESPALVTPGVIDVTGLAGLPDEEIFGPLLQVIRVADLDAAIDEANRTAYGLAAAIFCRSPQDHQRFFDRSRAGIVNWNRPTTGASSAAPFGGIGKSGNHNPSAYFAADYCAYPVASLESEQLTLPQQRSPGL